MTEIADAPSEVELPIIEVPAELRGLPDAEIIKLSQKVIREVSGKRKKGERRPGKRARQALREHKSHQEAMAIFVKKEEALLEEKMEMVKNAFSEKSVGYSSFDPRVINKDNTAESLHEQIPQAPRTVTPTAAAPTSGRVLKASFGVKIGEKPKAVIVSAADLAMQKAEERAKKIREALFAKRMSATQAGTPGAAIPAAPDGQPVKRPRGRPRKNPIV